MRLKVPKIDLRKEAAGTMDPAEYSAIIDEDTGETVGYLAYGHQLSRHVRLFNEKYQGSFGSHEECVAFAKGVEAVLSHMTSTGDK